MGVKRVGEEHDSDYYGGSKREHFFQSLYFSCGWKELRTADGKTGNCRRYDGLMFLSLLNISGK